MNRKEWIEYFEAINNRKPTIQECQQALLNGEFVMEGKQATFSNSGKSVTEGVSFISCCSNKSWTLFVFFQRNKLGRFVGN